MGLISYFGLSQFSAVAVSLLAMVFTGQQTKEMSLQDLKVLKVRMRIADKTNFHQAFRKTSNRNSTQVSSNFRLTVIRLQRDITF